MVSVMATDIYLPTIPQVSSELKSAAWETQLTLSCFFVSFALFQLIYGGVSARIGYLRTLFFGGLVFLGGCVGASVSGDIYQLMVYRFFQGVGAAAATAIVPVMIQRMFDDRNGIKVMSWLGSIESLAPALAPILGSILMQGFGWRSTFFLLGSLWVAAALSVVVFLGSGLKNVRQDNRTSGWGFSGYFSVFRSKNFFGFTVSQALALGALLSVISAAPKLIVVDFGESVWGFSAMQVMLVASFIIGSVIYSRKLVDVGVGKVIGMALNLLLVSAILLFIISFMDLGRSWLALGCAMIPSQVGLGMRFGVGMAQAIRSVPDAQEAAAGMFGFVNFVFAALGTAFAALIIDKGVLSIAVLFLILSVLSFWAHWALVREAVTGECRE